jgi:hypothetical protein
MNEQGVVAGESINDINETANNPANATAIRLGGKLT